MLPALTKFVEPGGGGETNGGGRLSHVYKMIALRHKFHQIHAQTHLPACRKIVQTNYKVFPDAARTRKYFYFIFFLFLEIGFLLPGMAGIM